MNKTFVFMGTGPFALTILRGLFEHLDGGDKLAVYTKAPQKSGRGMKEKEGAVALFAKEHALSLYQPQSLKDEEAKETFLSLQADLVVVASYGLLLPDYVLFTPPLGCVNLHASLLPEYRGAAPINRAIMDGKTVTGVTLMKMDLGLDTGDMLRKEEVCIGEETTAGDLLESLADLGCKMLLSSLPALFEKRLEPVPQDHSLSTYAKKITREDQELSFELSAKTLSCRIRGLSPIPGAICHTKKDGKLMKILSARALSGAFCGEAGEIIETKPRVLVKTGEGALELILIQPEGKGKMSAADAVNGRKLNLGDLLV